jgi:Heparinase II/III-like protein
VHNYLDRIRCSPHLEARRLLITLAGHPQIAPLVSANRKTSGRGIRLPLASARFLSPNEPSGVDLDLVETAIAQFNSRHPYLLFHKPAVAGIRKRASSDPRLLARLETALSAEASCKTGGELRSGIKRHSRRLIQLSFLALISDGVRRAQALSGARATLSRFAAERSWNARPAIKSFLDSAEIAVAVCLAYDWLYDDLSAEEREIIEASLFRCIIEPALAAYNDPFALWPKRRENCTLVSNSGILMASLAVLARYQEPAIKLIRKSLASSWSIFGRLAPDGVWPEGLSYWSLAMRYAGLMVAALESTFGHSFGLAYRPGLAQTGDFALHAVGPFGAAFNFGDSEPRFDVSSLAWFAHRFKRPVDARLLEEYDGWYLPFTVIWGKRAQAEPGKSELPTGKVFHSGDLACFRNTWSTEPAARPVYVAIKGGNVFTTDSGSSARPEDLLLHAQADAGSFIVDGAKQRWIIDLGPDDYDLPGYFDHGTDWKSGPRWRYYRTQAAGHNTLVIDGCNQLPNAHAPIIGDCVDGDCKWAVFDLSAAYGKAPGSIRRGAALIGRQIVIQDEIGPEVSGTVIWNVHTCAEPVSVTGAVARFRLGDDRFTARILAPKAARFEIGYPPEPHSYPIADVRQLHGRSGVSADGACVSELPRRADHDGERAGGAIIRRLQIVWPEGTRRVTVALLPDCDDDGQSLPVTPLNEWLARRPVRLTRFPQSRHRPGALRAPGCDRIRVGCASRKLAAAQHHAQLAM